MYTEVVLCLHSLKCIVLASNEVSQRLTIVSVEVNISI